MKTFFAILVSAIVSAFASPAYAEPGNLPDKAATPGATNPDVTQANIGKTICVSGWTATIRPPASFTTKLKAKQLASGVYKSSGALSDYEEDHLISLELGGNPTDERNLWPQHWSHPWGAHEKDQLENAIKKAVCAGKVPLKQAQQDIATDWVAAYPKYVGKH